MKLGTSTALLAIELLIKKSLLFIRYLFNTIGIQGWTSIEYHIETNFGVGAPLTSHWYRNRGVERLAALLIH